MEDFDDHVNANGGADDGDQDGFARFAGLGSRGIGGGRGSIDFGIGNEFFRHKVQDDEYDDVNKCAHIGDYTPCGQVCLHLRSHRPLT